MIINRRVHYGYREGAKRLHKAGKPKETQRKYREAEKWATESGPQVVELARELLRNWDSLVAFRKARAERQPNPGQWGPLTVEVEDESAEEFKMHFILNPKVTREDVQRRLSHLRQLDFKPGQHGPWWKLDYAREKALKALDKNIWIISYLDKNIWIISYLESLDHKKYTPLYVVQKGNYFEYRGEWGLSFNDNEDYVWRDHQPQASHHRFASSMGYGSYKASSRLRTIADPENTIVNLARNPVAIRHNFLGDKKNPVAEAEVRATIRELLIDGKIVDARGQEARDLIKQVKESL